jgi:predicted AlkP superfamily pyrophosphatase or phosphodiesterase
VGGFSGQSIVISDQLSIIMQKTVVIDVVGLTSGLIGEHTPFLKQWSDAAKVAHIEPVLPAVTCSAQMTYATGKLPSEHGIVGNGWYYKDVSEIKFWHQSNKLVQSPMIWEALKEKDPSFTCSYMFWWFNMYANVDFSVTPRPQYLADGRKAPDCYSHPAELRDRLHAELGVFPLFDFWGPRTSIKSTRWIADASMKVDDWNNPTMTFIYLPHLDYNIQRHGNDFSKISKDLNEIDVVCKDLITFYEAKGAKVILLSEYGITNVDRPVALNRVLREKGYIAIREERGTELLDAGESKAFAVADHQLAHIYVNDKSKLAEIKKLIEAVPGVDKVLDATNKAEFGLTHDRAGDLIAVADTRSWFTYYYWLDDEKAPDFARIVEIHKKPGYDPVEMFADPKIKFLMPKVALKLLKKKLGFRMLMDIIPMDATLIKGSHGRVPENKADWPVLIGKGLERDEYKATDVFDLLVKICS